MKRISIFWAVTAISMAAQDGTLRLDQWKVHSGDDPRWAAKDFDDRGWTDGKLPGAPDADFHWYRKQVAIPVEWHGQRLALGFGPMEEAYEVYVDGVRVGGLGVLDPKPVSRFARHTSFALAPSAVAGPVVQIAVRRWIGQTTIYIGPMKAPGNAAFPHPPRLGRAELIDTQERLHGLEAERSTTPWRVMALGLVLLGLLCLLLYRERRNGYEYLWLGLAFECIGLTTLLAIVFAFAQDLPMRSLVVVLILHANFLNRPCLLLFLREVCPAARWFLTPAAYLACLSVAYSALGIWLNWAVLPVFGFGWFPVEMLAVVVTAGLLARGKQKHGAALAGSILLVPLSLFYVIAGGPAGFHWHGYEFGLMELAVVVFAVATLATLYLRFREEQQQQQAREQELAAGQRAQQLLLERSADQPEGFEVQKAYLPASEVGGDFYQTIAREDGGLLVLVGDVSGKGLEAAMKGAALLGALGLVKSLPPGEVLAHLNEALRGRSGSGFVTCCCALFDPDGTVTLANAGHPAPYCDGGEVAVEGGLPLGIMAGVEYGESVVRGDRFTFVSDGVVEAANAKGELFGFDRTREISMQSAQEISDAAKAWGQNDDITVVTVRRVS